VVEKIQEEETQVFREFLIFLQMVAVEVVAEEELLEAVLVVVAVEVRLAVLPEHLEDFNQEEEDMMVEILPMEYFWLEVEVV
jgi:hypothetical protein